MNLGCNHSLIASQGWYTDGGGSFTGQPFIQCQSTVSSCTGTGFTTISQRTYCTDFSTLLGTSSGALMKKINLARSTNITVGFTGTSWPSVIRKPNGAVASSWRLVTRINLPQTYPINVSPSIILFSNIIVYEICDLLSYSC